MRVAMFVAMVAGGLASLGAQVSTDIFLAPLSVRDGRPVVGVPVNVTRRAGYDNQPSFTPDSRAILFTSTRDDGQSDIYRFDISSGSTTRLTSTPESEYSATVMPGGERFSVIRVERDSAQRLWSFALDGSDPKLVIASLAPVGYHAWLNSTTLVMFVLGGPNALVYGDLRTGRMDTLARRIGRSLAKLPSGDGFSFTQTLDSAQRVRSMSGPGAAVRDLVSLPRGAQDLAWLPSGDLITGSGSMLLAWQSGATAWSNVADLASAGLSGITRLAVSPDGKWLAIVAAPRS